MSIAEAGFVPGGLVSRLTQKVKPKQAKARFVFRSVSELPTAIRGPPPPRVAHSTPLSPLYLQLPVLLRRAAGSVVAPGFVVLPRPSGACFKGVCTRLGGFPVPRRKALGRAHPLLLYVNIARA